jgi:hypothetical protein
LELVKNFDLFNICRPLTQCAWFYHHGLRPNIMVIGNPSAGKTFTGQQVVRAGFGHVSTLSHMTSKYFTTGSNDHNGRTFLFNEGLNSFMGLDEKGKDTGRVDPMFKSILTEGLIHVTEMDRDADRNRVTKTTNAEFRANFMVLSNDQMGGNGTQETSVALVYRLMQMLFLLVFLLKEENS